MDTLWLMPALACYALSAALFVLDRLSGRTRATGYAVAILGAGAIFHALDLTARGLQAGNIPVANFAQALSFLAWLTALAGLLIIVRLRLAVIGAFVAPAVTLALGAASLTTSQRARGFAGDSAQRMAADSRHPRDPRLHDVRAGGEREYRLSGVRIAA